MEEAAWRLAARSDGLERHGALPAMAATRQATPRRPLRVKGTAPTEARPRSRCDGAAAEQSPASEGETPEMSLYLKLEYQMPSRPLRDNEGSADR